MNDDINNKIPPRLPFQKGGAENSGQTIVETVLVLTLLFIILFVIVEFSRAWYLKNSLNNAARVAARVAAVTPDITGPSSAEKGVLTCPGSTNNEIVFCSAFESPGVPDGTEATLDVNVTGGISNTGLDAGDTVTVGVSTDFETIVPNLLNGIVPSSMSINSSATMRFELDL